MIVLTLIFANVSLGTSLRNLCAFSLAPWTSLPLPLISKWWFSSLWKLQNCHPSSFTYCNGTVLSSVTSSLNIPCLSLWLLLCFSLGDVSIREFLRLSPYLNLSVLRFSCRQHIQYKHIIQHTQIYEHASNAEKY